MPSADENAKRNAWCDAPPHGWGVTPLLSGQKGRGYPRHDHKRRDYPLSGKRPGTGASGVTSMKFHAKHGSWCWKRGGVPPPFS